jgi:hypothetical protein
MVEQGLGREWMDIWAYMCETIISQTQTQLDLE